jgi:Flp pilus assembly protein CpaB
MKKNVVKLLGIAFAVALLSTFLFYRLLVGKLASEGGESAAVVVAAHKLEAGSTLAAADVKLAAVAGLAGVKGTFSGREQVVGLTVLETIEANAPLTETHVAPRESRAAAGVRVPAGMRAISIHVVDSTGVVAMIRPGNRVDVHAVGNQSGGAAQLRTVLQNIEVLTNNAQTDQGQGRAGTQVVTVLVKPEQAEVLALADSATRVRLALRNPADNGQPASRRLALNQLFEGTTPAPGSGRAVARRRPAPPPACAMPTIAQR